MNQSLQVHSLCGIFPSMRDANGIFVLFFGAIIIILLILVKHVHQKKKIQLYNYWVAILICLLFANILLGSLISELFYENLCY